ncbi:MAG: DUF2089 domain-containing protein [bacterium]|nr:DUF2089 domain-containing protein [bacterium]
MDQQSGPQRRLPSACPSCQNRLTVRRLECSDCGTAVEGAFALPVLLRLTAEEQEFVTRFVGASGSLKQLAKEYGCSYPTVRNRLDALIERMATLGQDAEETDNGNE